MKIDHKGIPMYTSPIRDFFVFFFLLAFLTLSSFKAGESMERYYFEGVAQGTSYHINCYAAQQSVTKTQIDSILTKIDSSLSIYKKYSLISEFNESEAGVRMDDHLKTVISKSLEISQKSEGAFDITVYPLVNAWGFGLITPSSLPDTAQVKELLKNVGYQHLKIRSNQLLKNIPAIKIDVNGIAQGYSVDVIADFLETNKIYDYVVELGGEVRVKGKKYNNERFKIGIEAVNDEDFLPIQKYVEINEGAITTSGNYRKFYLSGKQRVSHLIDPKTGYYLQNNLISVTVHAKDAITADGYDNVLMNLGLENAMRFLAQNEGLSAYFVYTENGITRDTSSTGFPQIREF